MFPDTYFLSVNIFLLIDLNNTNVDEATPILF